jgi:glycosyltransferase involved in cell wall biosynthesis
MYGMESVLSAHHSRKGREGLINLSGGAGKKVSIVLPVYNEEKNIRATVEEIRGSGIAGDIIAVDDGSTDGSRELLVSLPVTVISHPVNLGYGAAVQTGLRHAVAEGYETVILMDADGQHIPSEALNLLSALDNGADIAIGSRFLGKPSGYPVPLLRRIGIVFFSMLARMLGGTKIYDVTSGFQAMRRNVAKFLADQYPVDFPDAEVIISLGLKKFRITEVPAAFRKREHGESMYANPVRALYYPFKSLLASFIVLLRLIREKK